MSKVLFIDDEPVYYRMILPIFKEKGHELHYSKSGMEGLAEVSSFYPDIIITDIRLPDVSGYEIAERLRRDPRFSRIPIIFVTGQTDLQEKLKAFELGVDDYLVKPFQPEELAARMGILLRRSEALKAVTSLEANSKRTATVVAVHSLRGGAGTSTFAVNIAVAFQQLWLKPTLLVDGVLTAGQVALMMDSAPRVTWADFAGLKPEHIDSDSIAKLTHVHQSGVKFIASPSSPIAPDSFSDAFWPAILDKLTEFNNFIVIDTSHDLSNMTIHMLDAASSIILVVTPDMASLHSAVCALDIYAKLGMRSERIFIVVNQIFENQFALKQAQIEKVIHRPIDMVVPFVPGEFVRSINFGTPYVFKNPESIVGSLFEDAAFWLSNDIHKNIPPVAPTPSWRRVQSRLQTKRP